MECEREVLHCVCRECVECVDCVDVEGDAQRVIK